ncbi:MAG: hypothetical protein ACK56Y_09760, partial [Pseudanabaena sp.]
NMLFSSLTAITNPTTRNNLKGLQSNPFKLFLGLGLGANRWMVLKTTYRFAIQYLLAVINP